MKVYVKVKAGSNKQEIVDFGEFRYLVYVKSRAEKNEANIEMINLLSKHMGVPAKSIRIKAGLTSSDKILDVD